MTGDAAEGPGPGLDREWLHDCCLEYEAGLERRFERMREDVTATLQRLVDERERSSHGYREAVSAARASADPQTERPGTSRAAWMAHREYASAARDLSERLTELHSVETTERSTLMLLDRIVPLLPRAEDLLTSLHHAVQHLRGLGERSPIVVRMEGTADVLTSCIPERLLARLDAHVPPKSRSAPAVEAWRRAAPHVPLHRISVLEDPECTRHVIDVVRWTWKGEEEVQQYVQPSRRIRDLVDGAHRITLEVPVGKVTAHVGPADLTTEQWEVYDTLVREGSQRERAAEAARDLVPA